MKAEPQTGGVIYGIDGRVGYVLGSLDDRVLFDAGPDPDRLLAAGVQSIAGCIQPYELGELPIVDFELILAHFCINSFGDVIGHNITCLSCQKKYAVEFSLGTYVGLFSAEIERHSLPDFRGHPLTLPSRDMIAAAPPGPEGLARAVWHKAGALAGDDLQALETYLEKTCPLLQEDISGPCPNCQTEQPFRFVLRDWVVMKLTSRLKQLVTQVHLLAATYHWQLDDILGLSQANRLALINTIRSHSARQSAGGLR